VVKKVVCFMPSKRGTKVGFESFGERGKQGIGPAKSHGTKGTVSIHFTEIHKA